MSRLFSFISILGVLLVLVGCQQSDSEKDSDKIPSSMIPGVNYKVSDSDHTGTPDSSSMAIKLPEGAPYSYDDLSFFCPGGELLSRKSNLDLDTIIFPDNIPLIIVALDQQKQPVLLSMTGIDSINEISAKSTAYTLLLLWYGIDQYNDAHTDLLISLMDDCWQTEKLIDFIQENIINGTSVLNDPDRKFLVQFPLAINSIRNSFIDKSHRESIISQQESIERIEKDDFTIILNSANNRNSGVDMSIVDLNANLDHSAWQLDCEFLLTNNSDRTVTIAVVSMDADEAPDFDNARIMIIPPSDYGLKVSDRNKELFTVLPDSDINIGSLKFPYSLDSENNRAALVYILGDGKNSLRRFPHNNEQYLLRQAVIRSFAYDQLVPFLLSFSGDSLNNNSAICLRNLIDLLVESLDNSIPDDYRFALESHRILLPLLSDFLRIELCFKDSFKISDKTFESLKSIIEIHSKIVSDDNLSFTKPQKSNFDNFSYYSVTVTGEAIDNLDIVENEEEITDPTNSDSI